MARSSDSAHAWVLFAAAALQKHGRANLAAADADKLLIEFEQRFGPCELCKGHGRARGATEDCPQCHGTGEKS